MTLLTLIDSAPAPRPVRFALVADTHIGAALHGDQAVYRDRFDRVIDAVNAARVDAVLMPGDLAEDGTASDLAEFARRARRFRARVLAVPGNHDVGNKPAPAGTGGPTAERVVGYEKAVGPSFYARRVRGVRVVGVNASLLGSGLRREAEQWAFLEKELARRSTTLMLVHYPPFLAAQDEAGDPYWNMEPGPRARLLALLGRGGVVAVLAGHLHRSLDLRHEGILVYSTPPVSFGLPPGKQPEGWTLVTVQPDGRVDTEFNAL